MGKTWFEEGHEKGLEKGIEKGIEKGLEKGIEKGQRDLLQGLLEDRFGSLEPAVLQRLQTLSAAELPQLGKQLLRAQSLQDLGLKD